MLISQTVRGNGLTVNGVAVLVVLNLVLYFVAVLVISKVVEQ